uniref:ZP domain-containing protein n=1 Tax=Steinernema glaseri TaxID=37863 RepID=A0A1I7Y573_9BILA
MDPDYHLHHQWMDRSVTLLSSIQFFCTTNDVVITTHRYSVSVEQEGHPSNQPFMMKLAIRIHGKIIYG